MNVLIVDDNERIRRTIKNILAQPGLKFYECNDGVRALECYREVNPECVLMDIVMPGESGFVAVQKIIAEYPDAFIVIVTNYDDAQYRALAVQLGAKGYVLKEDLIELRKILQTKQK